MMPHQNLLLLTVVVLTCSSVVIGYPHGLDTSVRFCGSQLADILHLVCKSRGGLNGPGAAPLGLRGSAPKGGVANECCERPCSWRTIVSYCANSTLEETQIPEATTIRPQEDDEMQLDSRMIDLLFGPIQVPKRRTRKSGCPKCNCSIKRARKPDRNRLSNNLNVGTVAPDLARHPVVLRNL